MPKDQRIRLLERVDLRDVHKNIKKSRAKTQRRKDKEGIGKRIENRGNRIGDRENRREERGKG